jgi:23S rRNA (guanine745-N1)-methyltransferase
VSVALDVALPLLACPHCRGTLTRLDQRCVGCTRMHRFDLARQGYIPLLGGRSRTDTGDDAAMVAARAEFLDRGHYRPIAEAVSQRCAGAVLEIGAGTGYYLAHTDPDIGIAVDSSRYAARRAARAHQRVASVLADAWAPLPIADAVFDTVLVIFAPRVPAEIARVMRPGGRALVATPRPEHLAEVRGPLGMLEIDAGKAEAVAGRWSPAFTAEAAVQVTAELRLGRDDLRALVAMGPSARHRTARQIGAAVDALDATVSVTLAVTVTELRRQPATRHAAG